MNGMPGNPNPSSKPRPPKGQWWNTRMRERTWWFRFRKELMAIGCIVPKEVKRVGDVAIQVPTHRLAESEFIRAKYAADGVVKEEQWPSIILNAWKERFADVGELHMLLGKAIEESTGKEVDALTIGVELIDDITDVQAVEKMRECLQAFGFPPGVRACSVVKRGPPPETPPGE